jgi:hypothetical protein
MREGAATAVPLHGINLVPGLVMSALLVSGGNRFPAIVPVRHVRLRVV